MQSLYWQNVVRQSDNTLYLNFGENEFVSLNIAVNPTKLLSET